MSKPSTSNLMLSGNVLEMHSAWVAFLQQVPAEERRAVGGILSAADVRSLTGINELLMKLICATLVGDMSPVVVEAVRPLLELMTSNVHAMNVQKGAGSSTGSDMAMIMADLARRLNGVSQVKATYASIEAKPSPEGLPDYGAVDREPVPVEPLMISDEDLDS